MLALEYLIALNSPRSDARNATPFPAPSVTDPEDWIITIKDPQSGTTVYAGPYPGVVEDRDSVVGWPTRCGAYIRAVEEADRLREFYPPYYVIEVEKRHEAVLVADRPCSG